MLSKIKNWTISSSDAAKKNNKASYGTQKSVFPHFVKETVNGTIDYKVGNTKTWKGTVWHYCYFTNHCDGMRWHTHKATDCKLRLHHLQSNPPLTTANSDTDESPDEEPANDQPAQPDDSNNITSLLVSTLNMCGDNPELQERITMDLSSANLV